MKGDAEKVSFGTVPSGSTAVTLSLASSVLIALALTKATYLKPKIPSSLSKCGHLGLSVTGLEILLLRRGQGNLTRCWEDRKGERT